MRYEFKPASEFWWAVAVAGFTVVFQALATFDPATMGEPRAWLVGLLSACVRAVAGAALAWLVRSREL